MNKLLLLALPLSLIAQETPSPVNPLSAPRNSITVEARLRAEDIIKAFDLLHREKPTLKISARAANGQIFSNISEIAMMPNGTWLLFRISTAQGIKNQFIAVDDVVDLYYQ